MGDSDRMGGAPRACPGEVGTGSPIRTCAYEMIRAGLHSMAAARAGQLARRRRGRYCAAPNATGLQGANMSAVAETVRQKGPRVWLDMDQKELDDAYDQAVYAPNSEQVGLRRRVNSAAVRARLKPQRLAYGPTPIEALDLYSTRQPNAPVMVSIHGGAWRQGSAKDNAEAADLFVNAGAHLAVPDFINVVDAGGSLFPMVEQVRRGIAWVYRNAASFGGDPNRIYLTGHSSGAQLGGCMVTTDWRAENLPADLI